MQGHKDLRVWQAAMDMVVRLYEITGGFPRYEVYGLASQMQRAAVSVPSNIAEGHAREHLNEYLHHLSFAQGSLCEVETQLEIAVRLKYVEEDIASPIASEIASVGRQLHALRTALQCKANTATMDTRPPPTPNT